MYCRGIRGATTVEHNDREEILAATTELLQLLIRRNDLHAEDVASAIFTVTEDLDDHAQCGRNTACLYPWGCQFASHA